MFLFVLKQYCPLLKVVVGAISYEDDTEEGEGAVDFACFDYNASVLPGFKSRGVQTD